MVLPIISWIIQGLDSVFQGKVVTERMSLTNYKGVSNNGPETWIANLNLKKENIFLIAESYGNNTRKYNFRVDKRESLD